VAGGPTAAVPAASVDAPKDDTPLGPLAVGVGLMISQAPESATAVKIRTDAVTGTRSEEQSKAGATLAPGGACTRDRPPSGPEA